ncbi:hypothetical protein DITRI_Ditri02bG0102700 [Diplodiscus trichospermus]
MMQKCGLNSMDFQGQKFTWFGRRDGESIRERLDRAMGNFRWLKNFPLMQGYNFLANGSNYSPKMIWIDKKDKRKPRRFKFENKWLEREECREIIDKG